MGFAEKEFLRYLQKFESCTFEAMLGGIKYQIGEGEPGFTLKFNSLPEIDALLESTTIALGETYMAGDLEIEGDLYEVFNSFLKEADKLSLDRKALKKILRKSKTKRHLRKNVKSHYDLDRHFYELVFGETLSQTTGYFREENDSLETAQQNNISRVLDSLDLKEGMSICEISFSRGALLVEAAKKYNVHGLLVALSKKQEKEMQETIRKEELDNLLEVKLIDYRELPKLSRIFDCVISIDMLEYIGKDNLTEYFNILRAVLKKEGILLLQSVNTSREIETDPWVKKYIKPGIEIPSLIRLMEAALGSGFKVADMEDMRRQTVKTCGCWYQNFDSNKEEIEEMFDYKFVRAWELYLNAYRAAFNIGLLDKHQMIFLNGCL